MNLVCEMYIRTGILLATLGIANAVADRDSNRTAETLSAEYDDARGNLPPNIVGDAMTFPNNFTDNENSSEELNELKVVRDSTTSTTQKYENSKLLFSYVVPVKPEERKRMMEKESEEEEEEEEEKEDVREAENEENEDVREVEDEDNEEVREAEHEDNEEVREAEDEDNEEVREAEDEENDDVREDEDGEREDYREDVEDEQDELRKEEDEEEDRPHLEEETEDVENDRKEQNEINIDDGEEFDEDEDRHAANDRKDEDRDENFNEERDRYESESDDDDRSHSGTEREQEKDEESTRPPIPFRRHEPPATYRERRPLFEFTTLEPVDLRPVSYSSVVYDPDGRHTKTELSGSFYQKPLKSTPSSDVFPKEEASEDTKTVSVTASPMAQERSIEAPSQEDDVDYEEPEAVTSNVHFMIEDDDKMIPKRVVKPGLPRHNIQWSSKPDEDDTVENYKEHRFRDKDKKDNYYETTIHTRFRATDANREDSEEKGSDNEESEIGDLNKSTEEDEDAEWREETVRENVAQPEQKEEVTQNTADDISDGYVAGKKDRNHLYEYVVDDGVFRQRIAENKPSRYVTAATTTTSTTTTATPQPNPEVESATKAEQSDRPPATEKTKKQRVNHDKVHYRKPYAFGTIALPDEVRTFKTEGTNDAIYNRIVSNIQSLFRSTTTAKPSTEYEQRFLASRGSCREALPHAHRHAAPHYGSVNYETFVGPSQTHGVRGDEEESGENASREDDEDEDDDDESMPKRLPVKTYAVKKKAVPKVPHAAAKKPSAVKVRLYPLRTNAAHREVVVPATYRNAVYLGPAASPSKVYRKVFYYKRSEPKLVESYSPSNQIVRIVGPRIPIRQSAGLPSTHTIIIRKLH